jgi:hypothetical protein
MANKKITDLPASAGLVAADLVEVVDDVAGTPTSQKATLTQVRAALVTGIVNAEVDAAAAIAGSKVSPDFGAQNIVTTGFASLGTTPATAGVLRIPYSASDTVIGAKDSGGVDRAIISRPFADYNQFGYAAAQQKVVWYSSSSTLGDGAGIETALFAIPVWRHETGKTLNTNPIIGFATYSSPYGVHGTVVSSMTDANYASPAAEYIYDQIEIPAAAPLTAGRQYRLPTPASDAASYTKEFANLHAMQQVIVTRADGAGTTVTLTSGQKAMVRVRPAGVTIIGATY